MRLTPAGIIFCILVFVVMLAMLEGCDRKIAVAKSPNAVGRGHLHYREINGFRCIVVTDITKPVAIWCAEPEA